MPLPEQKTIPGFPPCVALTIEFNEHQACYDTIEDWEHSANIRPDDWASADERAKAIQTNCVWTCHWYPDTPVAFYRVAASSFEALMTAANALASRR